MSWSITDRTHGVPVSGCHRGLEAALAAARSWQRRRISEEGQRAPEDVVACTVRQEDPLPCACENDEACNECREIVLLDPRDEETPPPMAG